MVLYVNCMSYQKGSANAFHSKSANRSIFLYAIANQYFNKKTSCLLSLPLKNIKRLFYFFFVTGCTRNSRYTRYNIIKYEYYNVKTIVTCVQL